jgi:pimeloyl-ACP methyl ester carboxylesterase
MKVEHHSIQRNGLHWHVVTTGPPDAFPILLLYSWTGNWTLWQTTLERLSDKFRCIAPDQLGFGRSDKPRGNHYQIALQAERARFILESFGCTHAHVIGHSMGGKIALTFAALYPEKVMRLVVVDPSVHHVYIHWPIRTSCIRPWPDVASNFLTDGPISWGAVSPRCVFK